MVLRYVRHAHTQAGRQEGRQDGKQAGGQPGTHRQLMGFQSSRAIVNPQYNTVSDLNIEYSPTSTSLTPMKESLMASRQLKRREKPLPSSDASRLA